MMPFANTQLRTPGHGANSDPSSAGLSCYDRHRDKVAAKINFRMAGRRFGAVDDWAFREVL